MALPSPELLDELYARYILNVPQEDLQSTERMMFLIEEAHWFYEDFYRVADPCLKSLSLKDFTKLVFEQCPGMQSFKHLTNDIYKKFQAFKQTVPVCGAIILDPSLEYILLLKGVKSTACWMFPRGKIGKDESDVNCAIREVMEETSFDVSDMIDETDFIETMMGQQRIRLYTITGVELSTLFAPKCRGEIGEYAWHEVKNLPASKEEDATPKFSDGTRHRYYMVWPFTQRLRAFIKQKRKADKSLPESQKAPTEATGKKSRRRGKKGTAKAEADVVLEVQKAEAEPADELVPHVAPLYKGARSPGLSAWSRFRLDYEAVLQELSVM